MTDNNGWAAAAVRIILIADTAPPIPRELVDIGEFNKDGTVLMIDIQYPGQASLQIHLEGVRRLLREHKQAFMSVRSMGRVEVFLGWTPRSPQESLVLDNDLTTLISAAGASVVFDTYAD